jgi:hypothetical protein
MLNGYIPSLKFLELWGFHMPRNRSHISGHGWLEFSGVPTADFGHKDQYCRNILTGDIYQKKTASTWELCGDLTNSNIMFGTIVPGASLGKVGDAYVNYTNLTMYEKTSETNWTARCKLSAL